MNEPTNIVTVQMEKDQSMTVTLNGRELQDVICITPKVPDVDCAPTSVSIELRVAQYNLLQPVASVEEEERAKRGKLLAAHEEGACIMVRMKDGASRWEQANPSRDGWQWDIADYRMLADE
jgi:hypothetical protein